MLRRAASSKAEDTMIGTLVGPYRIEKKLGQGGMGAVYEAVHETIERRVAIKVLNPQLAQSPDVAVRFINEARAVNLVNHPGLVQVSDFGQMPDGTAYIVMELLEGETLSKRLARLGGKMPLPEILKLVRQITSALQAAHLKGIVHRDLKPDLMDSCSFVERIGSVLRLGSAWEAGPVLRCLQGSSEGSLARLRAVIRRNKHSDERESIPDGPQE